MPSNNKRRKTAPVDSDSKMPDPNLPGFVKWETDSFLTTGGELSQMSKFDDKTSRFTQTINVQHADAFKLKPLIISEGPLKGRQVLMLEPVTDFFRFLDLPPEIRTMIYEEVLQEEKPIGLMVYKRRPVGRSFRSNCTHTAMTWDKSTGKWIGKPPSQHALLRLNKQVQAEAASVAYGSNSFVFWGFPELRAFLDQIGSMRKYLRAITLDNAEYHVSIAPPVLTKLKDAKELRSFTIRHESVCGQQTYQTKTTNLGAFVIQCTPLMKTLLKLQKTKSSPVDVLDIIKLDVGRLSNCGRGDSCFCSYPCKGTKCSEKKKHNDDTESQFRDMLARALGLKK